jgi:hypothetical protein
MGFCACRVFPPVGKPSAPVGVDGTKVLEKIEIPELPVNESYMHPETIDLSTRSGTQTRQQAPIPGPTWFAISLAECIEMVTGTCPLYGHDEDVEVSDDKEEEIN